MKDRHVSVYHWPALLHSRVDGELCIACSERQTMHRWFRASNYASLVQSVKLCIACSERQTMHCLFRASNYALLVQSVKLCIGYPERQIMHRLPRAPNGTRPRIGRRWTTRRKSGEMLQFIHMYTVCTVDVSIISLRRGQWTSTSCKTKDYFTLHNWCVSPSHSKSDGELLLVTRKTSLQCTGILLMCLTISLRK